MQRQQKKEGDRLKRRKKLMLIVGTGVLSLGVGILIHGIHRVNPLKLDQLIAQQLPPGSDEFEVLRFLDSQHIAHSGYIPELRRIGATIPNNIFGLFDEKIRIEFTFDEHGKLLKHDVRKLILFF